MAAIESLVLNAKKVTVTLAIFSQTLLMKSMLILKPNMGDIIIENLKINNKGNYFLHNILKPFINIL